jgi:hypothetical protein
MVDMRHLGGYQPARDTVGWFQGGFGPAEKSAKMPAARPGRNAAALLALAIAGAVAFSAIGEEKPAKQLFGAVALPADMKTQAVGFYSKGCMAGCWSATCRSRAAARC